MYSVTHTCLHGCANSYVLLPLLACACTHRHTLLYNCMHIWMHSLLHILTYACSHTLTYACIHSCTHTCWPLSKVVQAVSVTFFTAKWCINTRIHACTRWYARMYMFSARTRSHINRLTRSIKKLLNLFCLIQTRNYFKQIWAFIRVK